MRQNNNPIRHRKDGQGKQTKIQKGQEEIKRKIYFFLSKYCESVLKKRGTSGNASYFLIVSKKGSL